MKLLSIIVPLYNESKRIARTLPIMEKEIGSIGRKRDFQLELIMVDDGSTDDTVDTIKKISRSERINLISLPENSGKGSALKKGFEAARGDYILFMDADLSTPLEHLDNFIDCAKDDRTILIGTRKKREGLMKVPQSFVRRKLGEGFTFLSNLILGTNVSDFTCGFKLFPTEAGKKIFKNVTVNRWGFDSEVIFLAKKFNYRIHEISVTWFNDNDTKVRLFKDILGSFWDLLRVRINSISKQYDE